MAAPVTITFLGGVGEVGRNCTAIECEGQVLVIDYGLMFPDATMHGVDVILPDNEYLLERSESIVGLVVTHGHEDHVGGVTHFLRDFKAPVYGSPFTMALAQSKLDEARIDGRVNPVADGQTVDIGMFRVEFLPVTHSVPQSNIIVVHTPQGPMVHTGDFKLDNTPVDNRLTDLQRLGWLGRDPGIRVLMADSTNADNPGHSESESQIGETFRRLLPELRGRRIIASCFASHLHRVQQIADVAIDEGRTIFPAGRSMERNVEIARSMGILDIPERHLDSLEAIDQYEPGEVCVVCTGSQGEPFAALSSIAQGTHRDVSVHEDDVVILSSHPIPGNQRAVFGLINALVRRGAEVIHSGQDLVHTTGHAKRDELRILHNVARPEYFIPIEGEHRMLRRHADLAVDLGLDPEHAIVPMGGSQVVVDDDGARLARQLPHRYRYVHGVGMLIDADVISERRELADGGVVFVTATVDLDKRSVVGGPSVVSRGWAATDELALLVPQLEELAAKALDKAFDGKPSASDLERAMRRAVGRFVGDETQRRPPIVALIQVA
ncbi:MAG: ribonuclease J [Acidimicrobiales bacterium]|nr:ribonuclease J [Acidimicrobiales bacterium]